MSEELEVKSKEKSRVENWFWYQKWKKGFEKTSHVNTVKILSVRDDLHAEGKIFCVLIEVCFYEKAHASRRDHKQTVLITADSVATVAIVEYKRRLHFLMLEQHRPAAGLYSIEFSSGYLEEAEGQNENTIEMGAQREFSQETGFSKFDIHVRMSKLDELWTSPGIQSQKTTVFLTNVLVIDDHIFSQLNGKVFGEISEGEYTRVIFVPLDDTLKKDFKIMDQKTVAIFELLRKNQWYQNLKRKRILNLF